MTLHKTINLRGQEKSPSFWALLATSYSFSIFRDETTTVWSLSMQFLDTDAEGRSRWSYTIQEEGLAYGHHSVAYGTLTLDRARHCALHQSLTDKYNDNFIPNFSQIMSEFFADVKFDDPCPQLRHVDAYNYESVPF